MHYTLSTVLRHHPTSCASSVVLTLLSLVQPTLFIERTLRISRVADHSYCPTCHALQPRSSFMTLVKSHHKIVASRKGTLSPYLINTYEAKSLQLMLTAYWLAPIVLNIWPYRRLPDVCYPVVDLPCRSGDHTRWNYRPGSAAHPFLLFAFAFAFAGN